MKLPGFLVWTARIWTTFFWVTCILVPVVAVLARVHGTGDFGDPSIRAIAGATLRQALWSTVLSAAVGLPLGLWAARESGKCAAWLDTLLLLPSGVPTVVAATSWVIWLGRSGWLARAGLRLDFAYSLKAVILAHVFFNAPWVALLVAQARRAIPEPPLEAARTLGAGPVQVFTYVIWPRLRWALGAACAQVLALCSMSFALVLILGGGPPVETLETALYSRVRYGSLDLSGAAVCAAWELLITLLPWVVVLVFQRKEKEKGTARASRGRGRGSVLVFFCGLIFLIPYGAVVVSGDGKAPWLDPTFWAEIAHPFRLSLLLAVLTSLGACMTAVLAVVTAASVPRNLRPGLNMLLALPSGISVLVLGLGAWLAYGRWFDPFSGSLLGMTGLQVAIFFPMAYRMLWPSAQVSQNVPLEAAITLGASPWLGFWLVDWPRWRAPIASALALTAGAALGELAAVSLFYSENLIPLPLLISRWMAQYRFEEARAVSALLLISALTVTAAVSLAGRLTWVVERGDFDARP